MKSISLREKEDCAISALNILVDSLVKDYGHDETFWLSHIYSTVFIQNLKDVNTGYWGEGVAFHKSNLLKELNSKGVIY